MGVVDLECRIFYHDKCFDGACSASLFTRFHRECVKTADRYSYHGLVHRAGALFDENAFLDVAKGTRMRLSTSSIRLRRR